MQNRIKELLRERGKSNEWLADAVGAHPVTISKLISGRMDMTGTWMERLAKVFGVEPVEIIVPPVPMRMVTVKAAVQAGVFTESVEWDESEWYQVPVPKDPEFDNVELFGAEVRGPSMNRRYANRSVVVCTAPWQDGEHPVPGRRYVVQRSRPDGTVEVTVKLLHRDPEGGLWLLAESDDPRYQAPIPVQGDHDGEEIRVIGRVRYAVAREN